MNPKYTIIVPVYNVGRWVAECLDSVLNQQVADWECICVDDGSTDDSGRVLDEYAARDNRFRVIHKVNGGVSSARNAALDIAKGEWIVYIDGDDLLSPDALNIFEYILTKEPDAEMIHYEVHGFPENKSPRIIQHIEDFPITVIQNRGEIFGRVCGICFHVYGYKRVRVGDVRFSDYKIGEDRLYLAMCLRRCRRLAFCSAAGYLCRRRIGSALRSSETIDKFRDEIYSKLGMLQESLHLNVPLPQTTKRTLICILTEHALANIDRLESRVDVRQAWDIWFDVLNKVPCNALATIYQKCVVPMLRNTRNRLLGRILCIWPHKIKLLRTNLKKKCRR